MNRSILIVICDFLVSAMLSMMTGMVPAHTGGTGVGLDEHTTRTLLTELEASRRELERVRAQLREAAKRAGGSNAVEEAKLRELTEKLVTNLRQQEQLRKQLNYDPERTGKLTPAQLKAQLEEELRRRMIAEYELKDKRDDLKEAKAAAREMQQSQREANRTIRELSQENTRVQQELAGAGKTIQELSKANIRAQEKLAESDKRLAVNEKELQQQQQKLAASSRELAAASEALRQMNARIGQADRQTANLQRSLAFVTGKYNVAERTVAEHQGQMNKMRRQIARLELERNESQRRNVELTRMVKKSVSELTSAKAESASARKSALAANIKMQSMAGQLKEAERRLANNVFESYSAAAVALTVKITEERLMLPQQGGGTYYLPLVSFKGRPMLVGYLKQFAGDQDKALIFNHITQLEHLAALPDAPAKGASRLAGPLLVSKEDIAVAALPGADLKGRKALPLLTISQLKKRGVHDLYLFKAASFGKESAELGARCSLDVSGTNPRLFIRNTARGGSELKAAPGDFIIAREGDFVGIVTAVEEHGFNEYRQARVAVFSDNYDWQNAESVAITRPEGAKYFDAYAGKMRQLKAKLRKAE